MSTLTRAGAKARISLVQFPGSNCDMDCLDAMKRHFGVDLQAVWHTEASLPQTDAVILPGGFSYGDYLRSGALASHSPIMASVKTFASRGGPVIGICNGFQILTESHLLPGALLRNAHRKFVCRFVDLATAAGTSTYQKTLAGKTSRIPVAHGEGRYYIDTDGLKRLKDKGQIAFKYVDNPNGSLDDIAGIVSENGRVMGMMPHPERATDQVLGGSKDGLGILEAFLASFL
jgi:phosphoribosylformylglycinamidine synthase subunit PurQ / glutaminase